LAELASARAAAYAVKNSGYLDRWANRRQEGKTVPSSPVGSSASSAPCHRQLAQSYADPTWLILASFMASHCRAFH
jgi:hypothetical protein